jgi:hypothetical protein
MTAYERGIPNLSFSLRFEILSDLKDYSILSLVSTEYNF